PVVGSAPVDRQLRLQPDLHRVAPGCLGIATQTLDRGPHRIVRLPPGEPAIPNPPGPFQGLFDVPADPDRNRALHRQRRDTGCVQSARISAICSSLRMPRSPNSLPSPSYSTLFQPTPTPSRSRPPLRTSTSAACLATSAVCRCGRITTPVTSSSEVVCPAR